MKRNGHRHKHAPLSDEPPPTQDELNRMRLPGNPLGEEARWMCKRAEVHPVFNVEANGKRVGQAHAELVFTRSCAVRARSAYAARQLGAQRLQCEPGEVTVGIVGVEGNGAQ